MPGERATVELALCGVLPYADGEATFRFPLVVAPRYIPGRPLPGPSVGEGTAVDTDAVPDASRISPPVLLPGFPNPVRLSLEIELRDGAADTSEIRSSLHAVQEQANDDYRRIRMQPGERLDRDFILRFRLGGAGLASTLTLHPDAIAPQEGTFALTIVPPVAPVQTAAPPRDVVFLLDRSGSMEGWKIVAARRALAALIETLNDADRFCILAFDSTVESPRTLPDGLSPASHRARFRASEYFATLNARGGTVIAEPLERGVELLMPSGREERERILVLITDGQVGNEDQILELLGTRLKSIRLFTIGIDRAVNEAFLRRLAELGGGACELVESEDRLDEVMAALRRRIGPPLLRGLGLEPDGLAMEPGELVPRRVPDLFPGSPLLILGRYRGRPAGAIAIHGIDATGTVCVQTVPAQVRENPAISTAWARGQIRQLEDRYAAGVSDRSSLEKLIVDLSLRFRVLCRFTAYVAVDRSQAGNQGGRLHRITQPVESPEGWAGAPSLLNQVLCASRPSRRNSAGRIVEHSARLSEPEIGGGGRGAYFARGAAPAGLPLREMADLACGLPPATQESATTLADRLRSEGRMAPFDAAALVADLADSVQQIHNRGHVQGEISPDRVVLGQGGHPTLRGLPITMRPDLASLEARRKGASAYTPPDWLEPNGAFKDPRGDIYTLGVILYQILTCLLPFKNAPGSQELVQEILAGSPAPPRQLDRSIPAALEEICLKAMARELAARYATAAALASALRSFLKRSRKAFWK
jgi:Ca-activated chloride channel family protein